MPPPSAAEPPRAHAGGGRADPTRERRAAAAVAAPARSEPARLLGISRRQGRAGRGPGRGPGAGDRGGAGLHGRGRAPSTRWCFTPTSASTCTCWSTVAPRGAGRAPPAAGGGGGLVRPAEHPRAGSPTCGLPAGPPPGRASADCPSPAIRDRPTSGPTWTGNAPLARFPACGMTDAAVRSEQIRTLYSQSVPVLLANVVNAVIVSATLWSSGPAAAAAGVDPGDDGDDRRPHRAAAPLLARFARSRGRRALGPILRQSDRCARVCCGARRDSCSSTPAACCRRSC